MLLSFCYFSDSMLNAQPLTLTIKTAVAWTVITDCKTESDNQFSDSSPLATKTIAWNSAYRSDKPKAKPMSLSNESDAKI